MAVVAESVSLHELTQILNKNLVQGTQAISETVNGITTESRTVNIGPALAEALLVRNISNRPENKANLAKIVQAMVANEWKYDAKTISFDKYGHLLDGQHRLKGIVKSGKTLPFKVTTGFNPEIFAIMDIGKTRTGSDVLAIAGVENYKLCAQTANFIYQFIRGSISINASKDSRTALSHSELLKFVEVKPLLKESVSFNVKRKRAQGVAVLPAYMVSGLYFLFAEKSKADAEKFITSLLTGEELSATSPIFHLRNRLVNSKYDKTKRLQHNEIVKLVIVAWNKYRAGSKVKGIKIPDGLPVIV